MFRYTIDAGPATDVDSALATLFRKSKESGVAATDIAQLVENTGTVLRSLCEQGRQLAAVGSQMSVTREVEGKGFRVRITFRSSRKRSLLARLIGR